MSLAGYSLLQGEVAHWTEFFIFRIERWTKSCAWSHPVVREDVGRWISPPRTQNNWSLMVCIAFKPLWMKFWGPLTRYRSNQWTPRGQHKYSRQTKSILVLEGLKQGKLSPKHGKDHQVTPPKCSLKCLWSENYFCVVIKFIVWNTRFQSLRHLGLKLAILQVLKFGPFYPQKRSGDWGLVYCILVAKVCLRSLSHCQ